MGGAGQNSSPIGTRAVSIEKKKGSEPSGTPVRLIFARYISFGKYKYDFRVHGAKNNFVLYLNYYIMVVKYTYWIVKAAFESYEVIY